MKICLCISGQVRGELLALRQLKANLQNLPASLDVTVIISVWEKSGAKLDGALGLHQMERLFEADLAKLIPSSYYGNAFWSHFPGVYARLLADTASNLKQDLGTLFPEAILDIEPEIMDLEMPAPKSNVHVKRMLYKIWRCNEIKKKLESQQGPFDLVMRLRPDSKVVLLDSLVEQSFDDQDICLPTAGGRSGRSNDVVALGNSKALDLYAALFARTLSGDWSDIHAELNGWLKEQGLNEQPPRGFEYLGLEANKLLSFDDIKGANPFVDLLGLLYRNLDKDGSLKTLDRELTKRSDTAERNSLYHMKSLFFAARDRPLDAFNAFLQAEFSSESIHDYKRDRNAALVHKFLALCRPFQPRNPADLVAQVFPEIMSSQLQENLNQVFALPSSIGFFQAQAIELAYKSEGQDALLTEPLPDTPPDYLADLYRDSAIAAEAQDLPKAIQLMSKAQKIRPNGLVIRDKLKEYQGRLAGK